MTQYRTEPNITFLGNEMYPNQRAEKICIDYSKRKVRMSLVLHEKWQRATERHQHGYRPKEERHVIHISLDSDLIVFEDEDRPKISIQ